MFRHTSSRVKLIFPLSQPRDSIAAYIPIFFIMGPGGRVGDWQRPVIDLVEALSSQECVIALQKRYNRGHPHYKNRLRVPGGFFFNETEWQKHFLERAVRLHDKGCGMLWIPREMKPHHRLVSGLPSYEEEVASYVEKWSERLAHNPTLRFIVGADRDISNVRYIESKLDRKVYPSQRELVSRALEVANGYADAA